MAIFSPRMMRAIRSRFWYVAEDGGGRKRIFFDNAAGSLVLKRAHAAIERYSRLSSYGGGYFPDASVVDHLMEHARRSVAMLLNAPSPASIFTGESATAVLKRLAEAILPSLPDRCTLIVSAADHNANIDPWRRTAEQLANKRLRVKQVTFSRATGTIDLDHLESLLDERVGLVAVSHASNVLGAENPIAEIRHLLDQKAPEALLIVDGVHFIPHGPADVQALGVDAYVFSSYKVFAQRGICFAYANDRILQLPHYKLAPAPDVPPESWEWGFRNPADLAPITEVVQYLAWLGQQCFPSASAKDPRELGHCVRLGQTAIRQYEHELVRAMLDGVGHTPGLRAIGGVTIYGAQHPTTIHLKEPTFSFNITGWSSGDVEKILWDRYRIAVRAGDHYARETLHHLGITDCVRASLAHYNTLEEVEKFLIAIQHIARHDQRRE